MAFTYFYGNNSYLDHRGIVFNSETIGLAHGVENENGFERNKNKYFQQLTVKIKSTLRALNFNGDAP